MEVSPDDSIGSPNTQRRLSHQHSMKALEKSESDLLAASSEGVLGDMVADSRRHVALVAKSFMEEEQRPAVLSEADGDAALAAKMHRLAEKAVTNPWYKVELRMARAIVNIAGKFEVDLESPFDDPRYTPSLAGCGLPKFRYPHCTKAQLGDVVETFLRNKESGAAQDMKRVSCGPRRSETAQEKNDRKERFESAELEWEHCHNVVRVEVEADFSHWRAITELDARAGHAEDVRKRNAGIIISVLNEASIAAHHYGIRFVYSTIAIVNTSASMRCVFNGENWMGQNVFREREVEVLQLSGSNTSAKSLQNLNKAIRLKYLYLDGCPLASQKSKSGRTKANVFDEMTSHGSVPELRCLSIVGTSAHLQSDWLTIVESRCPKLQLVYFSRRAGDKAVGWSDVVMMQSMRDPRILPCGHIGDALSLLQMRTGFACPICRTEFDPTRLVVLQPAITQLTRVDGAWKAVIVDALRYPLDDKCLYHKCGEFYNLRTLRKLYSMTHDEMSVSLLDELSALTCMKCKGSLADAQICFPRSAIDEVEFATLEEAGGYLAVSE